MDRLIVWECYGKKLFNLPSIYCMIIIILISYDLVLVNGK